MIHTLRLLRRFVRPYRLPLVLGCVLVFGQAAANLASPWPFKVVVDNVLGDKDIQSGPFTFLNELDPKQLLGLAILASLGLTALGNVADYASTRVIGGVGERLAADLRPAIFDHLQRQALAYHNRQRVGDLTKRLTADIDHIQDMAVAATSVLLPNLALFSGMAVVLALINVGFAAIALTISPLLFIVVFTRTRRMKRASRLARDAESDVAAVASEALSSIRVVQAYTQEPHQLRRLGDRNSDRLEAGLDAVRQQASLSPWFGMITAGGRALVFWFGALQVISGDMSLGLLLVFVFYLSMLYRPMQSLSRLALVVSRGRASAERVHEVLAVDARVPERPDARPAPRLRGAISLRSVAFGYEPDRPVIRDVSIDARPGEIVALSGRTGAGKSTLVSLIPRFYDPWEGAVLIDGVDIRDFKLESLRLQIGLVLQESLLFSGTIFDNIAFGKEDATVEEVMGAAEAAYVDEFARELPQGYETLVSERGTTLSGGQRQRVAIARALIRDAPILILDEPTSGLDRESEQYVLKGLDRLVENRTVVMVSHRESLLDHADRVYRLEAGRISEVAGAAEASLPKGDGRYRAAKPRPLIAWATEG